MIGADGDLAGGITEPRAGFKILMSAVDYLSATNSGAPHHVGSRAWHDAVQLVHARSQPAAPASTRARQQRQQGFRIITWNVMQGGGRRIAGQVAALAERQPDVVALQEVVPRTVAAYEAALAGIGLKYVLSGFAEGGATTYTGRRRYGVLVASRWPLRPLYHNGLACCATLPGVAPPPEAPAVGALPWPERMVSALAATPWGEFAVHSAYVPVWSDAEPLPKVETLEGIYARVAAAAAAVPSLLCADLNTPQDEGTDGTIITFAQVRRRDGSWRVGAWKGLGPRRDRAERLLFEDLRAHGMTDVFRRLHGSTVQDFSWRLPSTRGFRLDHLFASMTLVPTHCAYVHAFREARLSDHAPLEADLAPPAISFPVASPPTGERWG